MNNQSRNTFIETTVICLIILGSVSVWRGGMGTPSNQAAGQAAADPTSQLAAIKQPTKTFTIAIDELRQVSGPTTIRVKLHDVVRVNIKAAGDEEVVAGLDAFGLFTESAPEDNTPGGFSFVADKTGSFPYYAVNEAKDAKANLGKIVITD